MKIKWEIKSFFGCLLLTIIWPIIYLGICGGMMWFVDFSLDAFMAGMIVGGMFAIPLFLLSIAHVVHSFILIFKNSD